MQLRLQNFPALVQSMAASVQASSARLVDLSVGSVLRAVLEANAGVALWMQHLVLRVLQATRAATSTGADLDSWMADFSLARLPAVPAAGVVTFSRAVPGLVAVIPVGTLVRTADGARGFTVRADATHPAFSAAAQAYTLAADALALDVPVLADQPGAGGNVLAGTVTQLASPVPGVDAVGNMAAMAGGLDAETDTAFRARFQDYLATRARATTRAVGYAIAQVQQGLSYVIAENTDAAGAPRLGHFTVTVDDGSGAPSAALLAAITAAVENVRPVGSGFTLRPPTLVPVTIAATLALAPGAVPASVAAAVRDAILAHVNALPIGAPLPLSRIAQLAHDADAAVWGVAAIALNGAAADVVPAAHEVLKAGTVTVA
jgi:uncharacterized phage protein gp47/JayE